MKGPNLWQRFLKWMLRTTLADPNQWLVDWFGGGGSSSTGMIINEMNALNLSTIFAAVRILSESVASLPLILYRRNDRNKERAVDHPLYMLLHDAPNHLMSSLTYEELVMSHLCLRGNHYSEIERNNAGQIINLWPLIPANMQVRRPQIDQLLYDYTPTTGGPVTLRQDQVLHFRGLSGDGLIGYSPIRLAKETIGLAMAAEKFGAKFFSGGTTTKVVIKHPGKLSPSAKQNIGLGWQEANAGLDQMHRASVLDEGMDLIKIGVDPESAQMLATRQFQVKEIARIFNIPLHMLAEQEKASYASMEQEMLRFVQHTLRPWLVRIEQEINLKLLSPAERRVYFVEHLVDGLLRADLRSRYEAHYKGIIWGFVSRNEAREKENLPWRPEAEDLWQPVNIMDAGQTPLQPPGAGTITEPGANQ